MNAGLLFIYIPIYSKLSKLKKKLFIVCNILWSGACSVNLFFVTGFWILLSYNYNIPNLFIYIPIYSSFNIICHSLMVHSFHKAVPNSGDALYGQSHQLHGKGILSVHWKTGTGKRKERGLESHSCWCKLWNSIACAACCFTYVARSITVARSTICICTEPEHLHSNTNFEEDYHTITEKRCTLYMSDLFVSYICTFKCVSYILNNIYHPVYMYMCIYMNDSR